MRNEDFSAASAGRLVAVSGGAHAFVPSAVPRDLALRPDVARALGDARAALGRLEADVASLANPDLFVRPFQKNEAVLSSRIEGTHTTLEEAFVDAVAGMAQSADDDTRAVRNYSSALQVGIRELEAGRELSLTLIRGLQSELLKDDPHHSAHAGTFRVRQVVIGPDASARDLRLARFIPPPPEHLPGCLDDLADYLKVRTADDPLVRVALTHYQFETIHPFADGNGRVGRLLIALQMVSEGVVAKPWVYLSPELERRKADYMDAMYRVSAAGTFSDWLRFFLDVVLVSANDTLAKVRLLRALEGEFRERLKGYHSQLPLRLIPHLFSFPVTTIPDVAKCLACTRASARKTMLELESRKIVSRYATPLRHGQTGRPPAMYICDEIVRVLTRL
ncbi:MAG: Fic family protein [Planctomycetes bacterium]|nr:Fic family protein [Planctomycetota bacterium]